MKIFSSYFLVLVLLVSCSPRNLAYFSDLRDQAVYSEIITNEKEPFIRPDDILSISVTSLNAEANTMFNKGEILPIGYTANYGTSNPSHTNKEGYLVDKDGYIDFPVLGMIQVGGLTKAEAKARLTNRLEGYLKNPNVNIRYLNYKITVVGEVNRPATFVIPSEKINIFEAIGMAGDMTAFGKRENVLLLREEEGVRSIVKLDLNSKEVLSSPYFYLQQNDMVYVEPDKIKQIQASTNTRNIAILSSALTLVVALIFRL